YGLASGDFARGHVVAPGQPGTKHLTPNRQRFAPLVAVTDGDRCIRDGIRSMEIFSASCQLQEHLRLSSLLLWLCIAVLCCLTLARSAHHCWLIAASISSGLRLRSFDHLLASLHLWSWSCGLIR